MDADFEPPIFDEAAFQAENAERDQAASHGNTVNFLLAELEDAAGSKDATQAASYALATIQRYALKRDRQPLAPGERDAVLLKLMHARENMLASVCARRSGSPSQKAVAAFASAAHEAACALVVMWAETDPLDNRPREFVAELRDRTRWLRNELHNVSLENQVRRQVSDRARLIVDGMVANALDARHA